MKYAIYFIQPYRNLEGCIVETENLSLSYSQTGNCELILEINVTPGHEHMLKQIARAALVEVAWEIINDLDIELLEGFIDLQAMLALYRFDDVVDPGLEGSDDMKRVTKNPDLYSAITAVTLKGVYETR